MSKLIFLQIDNFSTENRFVRPHNHYCYELVFYFNSTGKTTIFKNENENNVDNNSLRHYYPKVTDIKTTFSFKPNHFILYEPFDIHDQTAYKVSSTEDTPQKILSIGFFPSEKFVPYLKTGLYTSYNHNVFFLMQLLENEYHSHKSFYEESLNNILSLILVDILRDSYLQSNYNISYAQEYINEYYMTNINIDKLASMSNYSVSQFRKIFKEQIGMSPKQYLQNKRISIAKKLLTTTDLPMHAIADAVGYEDYNQFQVFFKTITGLSPSDYKKENSKKTSSNN